MHLTVRTDTPRRLVLALRPESQWGYWLFGLLFMAAGVGVIPVLGRALSLDCTRDGAGGGLCRYAQARTTQWSSRIIPMTDLLGAIVVTRQSLLYGSMELVLVVRGGDVPIPLVGAGGATKDSLAEEINRFRADSLMPGFSLSEDARAVGWGFGLFLIVVGAVCLLAMERVVLIFDRDAGRLTMGHRRALRRRRTVVDLARVRGIVPREFRFKQTVSYSVTLLLDGGAEAPLTTAPLFSDRSAGEVSALIARWLGLKRNTP